MEVKMIKLFIILLISLLFVYGCSSYDSCFNHCLEFNFDCRYGDTLEGIGKGLVVCNTTAEHHCYHECK
jgi:hypothetical protein